MLQGQAHQEPQSHHTLVWMGTPAPPPRPETRWCHRERHGALKWTWRPRAAAECPWTSAGRGGGPEKEALPATSTAQGRCPLCGPATGSTAPGASLCSCLILWGRCPRTGTTTSASTQDPEGAWGSQSWQDARGLLLKRTRTGTAIPICENPHLPQWPLGTRSAENRPWWESRWWRELSLLVGQDSHTLAPEAAGTGQRRPRPLWTLRRVWGQ